MNSKQCKMARAALDWSAADLAEASGLGYATVARFESGHNLADSSVAAIRAALETAGATFDANGDWVSVSVLK